MRDDNHPLHRQFSVGGTTWTAASGTALRNLSSVQPAQQHFPSVRAVRPKMTCVTLSRRPRAMRRRPVIISDSGRHSRQNVSARLMIAAARLRLADWCGVLARVAFRHTRHTPRAEPACDPRASPNDAQPRMFELAHIDHHARESAAVRDLRVRDSSRLSSLTSSAMARSATSPSIAGELPEEVRERLLDFRPVDPRSRSRFRSSLREPHVYHGVCPVERRVRDCLTHADTRRSSHSIVDDLEVSNVDRRRPGNRGALWCR
jgi:hypothetical protein